MNLPGAPARLEAYADYWENCIRTRTASLCMCALLAAEILTLPDEVKSEVQASFRDTEGWLASTLEDGVHQGTLHLPRSSALEAKSLFAVVCGAMLAARVSGDAAAFGAVVGDAIGRLKVAALAAVYLLGSQRSDEPPSITEERRRGAPAMATLMANTYANYVCDARLRQHELRVLARLTKEGAPVYAVRPQSGFDGVRRLRDLIRGHASQSVMTRT